MANMALSGYAPLIPLDELITAMMDVGTAMPAEIRCGCSGCKATPTALRIAEQMQKEKGFSYEAM
jgi:L-serine dehydratase